MALAEIVQQIPGFDNLVNTFLAVQYVYSLLKKAYELLKKVQGILSPLIRICCRRPITVPEEADDYEILPVTVKHEESESVILEEMVTYDALKDAYKVNPDLEYHCAICLEGFGEESVVNALCCGHVFHATCIFRYLMNDFSTCPLCSARVRL